MIQASTHEPFRSYFRSYATSALTQRRHLSKSRRVAAQALWYVGAFYLTFTFATINRLIQQIAGKTVFATTVLHTIFEPAQGFLNYLVYVRPRFINYKDKNPGVPWYKVLRRVIFPDEQTFAQRRFSQYVDDDHEDEELARHELQHSRNSMQMQDCRFSGVFRFVNGDGAQDGEHWKGDDSRKTANDTEHSSREKRVTFLLRQEDDDTMNDVDPCIDETPAQKTVAESFGETSQEEETRDEEAAPPS